MATSNLSKAPRKPSTKPTTKAEPIARNDPLYARVIATLEAESASARTLPPLREGLQWSDDDFRRARSMVWESAYAMFSIDRLANEAAACDDTQERDYLIHAIRQIALMAGYRGDVALGLMGEGGVGFADEFRFEVVKREGVHG